MLRPIRLLHYGEVVDFQFVDLNEHGAKLISLTKADVLGQNLCELLLVDFSRHPQWSLQRGWKNVLNYLRLIIQPTLALWLLSPWLDVFPSRSALSGSKPRRCSCFTNY